VMGGNLTKVRKLAWEAKEKKRGKKRGKRGNLNFRVWKSRWEEGLRNVAGNVASVACINILPKREYRLRRLMGGWNLEGALPVHAGKRYQFMPDPLPVHAAPKSGNYHVHGDFWA